MDEDDELNAERIENLWVQTLVNQAQLDQLESKLDDLKHRSQRLKFRLVDVILAFVAGGLFGAAIALALT